MFKKRKKPDPRLSFPTRHVPAGTEMIEEYIIPDEEKVQVLDKLYPFDPVPALTEMMYDLHEEKQFRVGDFRVIRGAAMDMLELYFLTAGEPSSIGCRRISSRAESFRAGSGDNRLPC